MITREEIEEAIRNPNFSHARQRRWCGVDLVYIYHRDKDSPTGVKLAVAGEASIVDPILRVERNTSALSPTER